MPTVCAQSHRFTYNEPMPVESCTQSLCDLALRFGEDGNDSGMVRGRGRGGAAPASLRFGGGAGGCAAGDARLLHQPHREQHADARTPGANSAVLLLLLLLPARRAVRLAWRC
jgi:hypothetical protein